MAEGSWACFPTGWGGPEAARVCPYVTTRPGSQLHPHWSCLATWGLWPPGQALCAGAGELVSAAGAVAPPETYFSVVTPLIWPPKEATFLPHIYMPLLMLKTKKKVPKLSGLVLHSLLMLKFETGFTGLGSGVRKVKFLSGGPRGESLSLPSPASRGICIPWPVAPPPSSKLASPRSLHAPPNTHFKPPRLRWAHWDGPRSPSCFRLSLLAIPIPFATLPSCALG